MSKGTITPIVVAEFVFSPSVSHKFISGDRPRLGIQMGLSKISMLGQKLDVLERGQSTTGRITLIFDDKGSQLRRLATSNPMKNKRVVLRVGDASATSESDLEIWGDNLRVEDVVPMGGNTIHVPLLSLGIWQQDQETPTYRDPDHYLFHLKNLGLEIYPASGFVDEASFDETAYTDTSHHVVTRQFANDAEADVGFVSSGGLGTAGSPVSPNDETPVPAEKNEQIPITKHMKQLSSLSRGAVIQRATGEVKFVPYDRTASIARVLGEDDIADFKQPKNAAQLFNSISIQGQHGVRSREDVIPTIYAGRSDPTSKSNFAFESAAGSTDFVSQKIFFNPWINSVCRVDRERNTLGLGATTLVVKWPLLAGFSGTVLADATGVRKPATFGSLPAGTPQTEHTLNGTTRTAHFFLTDHLSGGLREIVEATSFSYDTSKVDLELRPDGTTFNVYRYGTYTITRGALGTTAQNWLSVLQDPTPEIGVWCYDITIPIWMLDNLLDRTARGLPIVTWVSPLRHSDLEITDVVGPISDIYMDESNDGLDGTVPFEIVGTEPAIFKDQPGVKFTAAKVRNDALPAFDTDGDVGGTVTPFVPSSSRAVLVHTGASSFDEVYVNPSFPDLVTVH
ncbi:MAG: hypothetical protein GTO22_14540 [Gemmatimonadales bacterium]|nr:hypothetical protein [Gemmatimonadales bacterium]